MRGGKAIDWSDALGVPTDHLHAALRSLWRQQEELYGQQAKLRNRVHAGPDRELDEHLSLIERYMGEASQLLGRAVADAAREVG